jgi:hypothetical protein
VAAMPFALRNELRPLLPIKASRHAPILSWSHDSVLTQSRSGLYFTDLREDLKPSYMSAAEEIQTQGCRNVGLDISFEDHDYLLMAFLNVNQDQPRVSYSGVYNLTALTTRIDHPPPCAIVCFACALNRVKWNQYRGFGGRVSLFGDIALFSAKGRLPNVEEKGESDPDIAPRDLAKLMRQRLTILKAMNSSTEFATVLRDAEEMKRSRPARAHDFLIRLESINETNGDAYKTMLNTTRLRQEADSNTSMSLTERFALRAAATELTNLTAEKIERLEELKKFEDGIRQPSSIETAECIGQ